MADPERPSFTLPASKPNRQHVIRACAALDVQFSVLARGSPHELVCQKTRASFQQRRALWEVQRRVRERLDVRPPDERP